MIRILIVDDHPLIRQGLRQTLADDSDMIIVGEAETTQDAIAMLRRTEGDILVLDLKLPGGGGLEVLNVARHEHPSLPVLVLSVFPEDQYAVRVLRAGASGYATKESAPDELVKAIRKIVAGGKYISNSLAEQLASDLRLDSQRPPHESLSDREHQVFYMLAGGKSVSEIARELSLSVKTISTYRSRVLHKMGMKNNAELTRYAIQHRLVD